MKGIITQAIIIFFFLFSIYLDFPHIFTWIVKKSQAQL